MTTDHWSLATTFMRMHFGENSRMALETVRDHKTRSFLTVLGVVIGVAAMIFVASILVGVSRDIQGYLDDYGTNTLFIFRWDFAIRAGRMSAEERNRKPLTFDDAKAILAECPHVKSVTVELMHRIQSRRAAAPTPSSALWHPRDYRSGLHRRRLLLSGCVQRTRHSRAGSLPTSRTSITKMSP